MRTNVVFLHKSENTDAVLKQLVMPTANHLVAVYDENGTEGVENIDIRLAVPGRYTPDASEKKVVKVVRASDPAYFSVDIDAHIAQGSDLPANIDVSTDASTTYPYNIYKIATEDWTLPTLPAVPSWITTETAIERATRIKNAKVLGWNKRLKTLADDFIEGSAQIRDWVHRHAYRGHTSPKFYRALDPNPQFHANELEAGDNAAYHRAKLIGAAKRLVELYLNAAYGTPMIWPSCPVWAQNDSIKTGDYRRHSNNRIWIAKSNHTSANDNAPSTTGGDAVWAQAKMNAVPSSIVKADNTSVTIDTATGAGIEEFIAELEAEFKAFGAYDFYVAAREERAAWTAYYDGNELHFIDSTTHRSRLKVFDATVAPHNSADSNQVAAANVHSGQAWIALHDHDFLGAYHYVAPSS